MPPNPPRRITAHAQKLQRALEGRRNRWHTRRKVALAIGKKRLTPYDIQLLDLLAAQGLIRATQEEGYSREGFRWLYGVFDPDADPDAPEAWDGDDD